MPRRAIRHAPASRLRVIDPPRSLLIGLGGPDEDFPGLTHEFLAPEQCVRRAGVAVAIHMLERRGLVRATRGRLGILGRAGWVATSKGA